MAANFEALSPEELGEWLESYTQQPIYPTEHVGDVDVTFNELADPTSNPVLKAALELLRQHWVGKNENRADDTRIGTVYVFVDDEGVLHMDFRSRFTVR